jgi:putative nucleotidyltransferase with HDIG domain
MKAPRTPAELFQQIRDLASLDAIHAQLLATLNDPGSSLSDLLPLIDRDPMLTARILKRSNSAFFGRSGTVTSVHDALAMLGLANIRELILATAVFKLFERIPPDLMSTKEFWRHSVAVAFIARELGRATGWTDLDGLQTAGLLHDVGRVLMLTAMPVEYHKAMLFARAARRPLLKVEHELFGFTHTQVGGDLFEAWGMPLLLVQAARFHHQPQEVHRFRQPVELVQLADYLAHGMELGLSGETRLPPLPAALPAEHGLAFPQVCRIVLEVEESLADTFDLLMEG